MWIEITIPADYRMPYSEYQIQRHMNWLNKKAKKEAKENDDEFEAVQLYRIYRTQVEADVDLKLRCKLREKFGKCITSLGLTKQDVDDKSPQKSNEESRTPTMTPIRKEKAKSKNIEYESRTPTSLRNEKKETLKLKA